MREGRAEWLAITVVLGVLRVGGSLVLEFRLAQRGIHGWLVATAILIGSLLCHCLGSASLLGVAVFTNTEAPEHHATAVAGYAFWIALSRWLHIKGVQQFRTPQALQCITVSRSMREETEKWHEMAVTLGLLRLAGSGTLCFWLTKRQLQGSIAATGFLLGSLLFQSIGSASFVAVVQFTITEAPKTHAAAVACYAVCIALSRYLYLRGFRLFQLHQEEPLEEDMTNVNYVCLGFTACTLVVLWMNSREKSAEWECLGGKLEWISETADAAFLLLSASGEA